MKVLSHLKKFVSLVFGILAMLGGNGAQAVLPSEIGKINMMGAIDSVVPAGFPASYANTAVVEFANPNPDGTGKCTGTIYPYLSLPLTTAAQKAQYALIEAAHYSDKTVKLDYFYNPTTKGCTIFSVSIPQ